MRFCSKIFIALSFSSGLAASAQAAASLSLPPTQPIEVRVDKGRLTVEWTNADVPYHLDALVPKACVGTKLAIIRESSKLSVAHTGAPCNEPTHFVLTLSKSRSVNISLDDGVIETPHLVDIIANVQQIHATVTAGRVASSLQNLVPTPSHDYYSMAVNWAGGPVGGICVELDMKAGAIQL